MLVDGNEVHNSMNYDLCIVGSGAAGITLAREFLNSKFSVALIESGGMEVEREAKFLNDGQTSESIPASLNYLRNSRVRAFGGTTNIWTGWTRPLDDMDFEKRKWVADSGWPFSAKELLPFYERAAEICQVKTFNNETIPGMFEQSSKLVSRLFHFSPPTRFGSVYRKELEESKNVSVLFNSSVTKLITDKSRRHLREVEVKTLSDIRYTVRAKVFVIACGGIENSRLLLLSGLGNRFDTVGRYFMEHPHLNMAHGFQYARSNIKSYFRANEVRAFLSPTRRLQEEKEILNFAIIIHRTHDITPQESRLMKHIRKNASQIELSKTRIELRVEQQPHSENRVILSDKSDKFGNPLPKLNWKINSSEIVTASEGLKVFGNELGANGVGRVKYLKEHFERAGYEPSNTEEGWMALWHHHMGGTRMHEQAIRGVVDPNCKVHGMTNLFVAGSSVFPSGFANPTLTIVALAARLGDHLKIQLPRMGSHA
jgi:choline dehydrogenase-like flavoprotein